MKNILYKPKSTLILIDFLVWALTLLFMLFWRIVADKSVITDYAVFTIITFLFWVIVSFPIRRYYFLKQERAYFSFFRLIVTAVLTGLFSLAFQLKFYQHLSLDVIFWQLTIITISLSIITLTYYTYRYVARLDEDIQQFDTREKVQVLKEPIRLKENRIQSIENSVREFTNTETLQYLSENIDIKSSNTLIFSTSTLFNIQTLENYRFDVIVNLLKLNNIKEINKIFCEVNSKLPDNGLFICNYESLEAYEQQIKKKYPKGISDIVSVFNFVNKRIFPKLLITSRLWFDLTQGKNRVFSETEILGRLYFCGFEFVDKKDINNISWVIVRRKKQPDLQVNKRYGLIIKLPRIGKNHKIVNFYKMRTMHPYAEYIQKFVYDNYGTDDGDKAKNDFRITKWGAFFRKVWIDELPMVINILKGDMKIVGVRPLSKTKFETYPLYLQEKRTLAKPGLFPPYYVDLPTTQEEMFESENRYLDQYLKSPVKTDAIYFFKSLYNIIIKRARSH